MRAPASASAAHQGQFVRLMLLPPRIVGHLRTLRDTCVTVANKHNDKTHAYRKIKRPSHKHVAGAAADRPSQKALRSELAPGLAGPDVRLSSGVQTLRCFSPTYLYFLSSFLVVSQNLQPS